MWNMKLKKIKKEDYWKILSGTLGILLIFSLYNNLMNTNLNGLTGSMISIDEASIKALNIINNNLLEQGTTAELIDKTEESNLYKIKIEINNQEMDSYVSNDGKLLFINAVDLDNPPQTQTQPQQVEQPETTRISVSADDDAVKGDENAPVTIIEFSDFECPFCARFYAQTLPDIQREYVDTGKVKLVFRDFPLGFHANAQKASEAAECANEQGNFWEMHDKLFEEGVSGGVTSFKQYASDLGLNTDTFNDCLDTGKYESEVQNDLSDGQSYGVSGTPAFFINGILVTGAQPFEVFKNVIDEELAK
ncbi:MAG: DsbA family protein [Nanoarchaeota archaeon]|nr:DsbA family protein [Nanoarchaeota archaeon]